MHHVPSLIARKRDGDSLTAGEIQFLVDGLTDGSIPEYQWSALAMAIFFKDMSAGEKWALTRAMRDSGEVLDFGPASGRPPVVDKHSTGGIGDKTSLILAPLLACDGLWVPMISGRGLGITGGTLDKLESIPGFRTGLSREEMMAQIAGLGVFMAGQTPRLCPADRKLYALRDVTGTVPSIALITASIMSKKLAEGLDRLVLDVKYGSGAFMRTRVAAEELAESMRLAGGLGGVDIKVLLNPMSETIGRSAGNVLEVRECVECLQGQGPPDLENLTLDLVCAVSDSPREVHAARLRDGSAWTKFQEMTAAQSGDADALPALGGTMGRAPVIVDLQAGRSGLLTAFDAGIVGEAVLNLGAGRRTADDPVDHRVGLDEIAKTGTWLQPADLICRIHARTEADADEAAARLRLALDFA
ncbi:MAG: thymidine phosphorylase [Verrucomicrobiota bacterium]